VGEDRTPPQHRTTVAEAAEILGISAEAVRGRIRRGTLPVERESGTVYVLLDHLIAELQDRVRSLEEANRENRRIIAALTSRIPAIEAPQEATETPETVEGEPERAEPRPATGGAQEGARRPWWRRVLGR
jgi:hypothetical protein